MKINMYKILLLLSITAFISCSEDDEINDKSILDIAVKPTVLVKLVCVGECQFATSSD